MKIEYDYSKLKGRIRERFVSQKAFAEKLGVTPETMTLRLNGKRDFTRTEIFNIASLLGIAYSDLEEYFFCVKGVKPE